MNEEFIKEEEKADYCYLYEAFYYIMLKFLPKKYSFHLGSNVRLLEVDPSHEHYDHYEDDLNSINKVLKLQKKNFEDVIAKLETAIFLNIIDNEIKKFQELENEDKEFELKAFKKNFKNPYSRDFYNDPYKELHPYIEHYFKLSGLERQKFKDELKKEFENKEEMITPAESIKREKARRAFDAIFYEEYLENIKRSAILKLLELTDEEKVAVFYYTNNSQNTEKPYFQKELVPLPAKLTYEELKLMILKRGDDLLLDCTNLYKHIPFETVENKRMITTYSNGIQYLMTKDNSAEYGKGGKNSYGNTKKIREKAKEIALSILQDKNLPEAFDGKRFARRVAKILEDTESKLVMDYKKILQDKNQGVDWIEDGIYAWCKDIFQSYRKKNKSL